MFNTPLPDFLAAHFAKKHIKSLNPVQKASLDKGLFNQTNLLVSAPTASGKTLIAVMAAAHFLECNKSQNKKRKIVYLVPLKALASEKSREFKEIFSPPGYEIALSMGDLDSASEYLHKYDIIILTVEKLDSLIRHHAHWTKDIGLVIVDEIHLLNDAERGPNLEVLLTLLRSTIKPRIIGLSATIGNAQELAEWLEAELVVSDWRPVQLKKGISRGGEITFYD